MVAKAREIDVPPGSELARAIDESLGAPIVVVKDGVRYRLERESGAPLDDLDRSQIGVADDDDQAILDKIIGAWAGLDTDRLKEELRLARGEWSRSSDRMDEIDDYDPEAARQNLRRWAGTWAKVDVDALVEDLYQWREAGSRVPPAGRS